MGKKGWLCALAMLLAMLLGALPALAEADFSFDLAGTANAGESTFTAAEGIAGSEADDGDGDVASEEEVSAFFAAFGGMDEDAEDELSGADDIPEDELRDDIPEDELRDDIPEDELLDDGETGADGAAFLDGFEQDAGAAPTAGVTAQAEATVAPVYTFPAQITITAAGDVTLGGARRNKTDERFARVARKNGADYFFSGVRQIFEGDDLTIVNLEGPLTTATQGKKGQYYCFKGDPAYVQILSGSSVEICNVANNHSLDYGTKGLKQTAQVLEEAGIGCSGYSVAYTTTIKGVRVTSLGFTKWDHSAEDVRKAVTAARRDCDILIVSMHWGKEKAKKPDDQQRSMGHAAVDAGADLVLGTHTHVYGGIEKYKGKYIVYSLGNFCFGGNPNPSDMRCLIFQQTLVYSPYTGVSDGGINIIPAKVSSSAKGNDYRPTVMGAKEGMALLKNVAKVSNGMSMSNILWKPDNYLVWSGIVTQEKLDATNAAARAAMGLDDGQTGSQEGLFATQADGSADDALFEEEDIQLGAPDLEDEPNQVAGAN